MFITRVDIKNFRNINQLSIEFNTAVNHYYKQACSVVEGILIAEKYRSKANGTVREVK